MPSFKRVYLLSQRSLYDIVHCPSPQTKRSGNPEVGQMLFHLQSRPITYRRSFFYSPLLWVYLHGVTYCPHFSKTDIMYNSGHIEMLPSRACRPLQNNNCRNRILSVCCLFVCIHSCIAWDVMFQCC